MFFVDHGCRAAQLQEHSLADLDQLGILIFQYVGMARFAVRQNASALAKDSQFAVRHRVQAAETDISLLCSGNLIFYFHFHFWFRQVKISGVSCQLLLRQFRASVIVLHSGSTPSTCQAPTEGLSIFKYLACDTCSDRQMSSSS
jgi:hypothetical protein